MNTSKTIVAIFMLFLFLIVNMGLFAQINKIVPTENDFYSLSDNTHNPILSKTQSIPNPITPQEQVVLNQLREARLNNDQNLISVLTERLNKMHGVNPVQLINSPNAVCESPKNIRVPFAPDYMMSQITNVANWSVATATVPSGAPNTGRIWTAFTHFSSAGSDSIKLFYSDNGGETWFYYTQWYYNNYNINYRPNEIDIEILFDNTNVWLMGVSGFTDLSNGRAMSNFWRINTTTFSFFSSILSWPGNTTTSNIYYNPRVCTDNSIFITNAYVYLTASFDSTYGSVHWTRQKYAYFTTPFAVSPLVNYGQPNPLNNGGFYWNSNNLPSGVYVWSDIAYFSNLGTDRIMTVYNIDYPGNLHSMFLAWSDNYGASVTGNLTLTEGNESIGARIAYNAGSSGNRNGMITYLRLASGSDWDPYYRNTTDGGSALTSWGQGYVDVSTQRARYVDIIAMRSASDQFKVAYIQDVSGGYAAYYTGWNAGVFNSPAITLVNGVQCDSTFGKVRAGYKLGGGDDCIAIWAGAAGLGVYATRLCQTTMGVNNNEIPVSYSLMQNYPNPFNPSTTIKFSIPQRGFAKLVIFDINGRIIATPVNNDLNAGSYDIFFDASNLSSGIYFYKLESGSFVETKKMVLIK
jgi:hypothetical protein